MQVPRWRNVLLLKNTLIPALSQSTISVSKTRVASIHSTPATSEKWKSKWNHDEGRLQQPSKTYVRYAVRQKRADTKRALKDLLFNSGCSKTSFQDDDPIWSFDAEHSDKKKKKLAQRAKKSHHENIKRKHRRGRSSEDFDDPERTFKATFGNRWYTWSFSNSSSRSSTSGFEWREHFSWTNHRFREWDSTSETKSDVESCSVGSCSDRIILGLPATGPLKIEDVKNAFRLSALKWHPDKHQGASQALAEEKFKLCVNAYKSLCDALS